MTSKPIDHYKKYGWKCSENNLATLPAEAPEEARDLAQWLTLEGRRSSLAEWLESYNPTTGKLHGKFWHIGAWTGRMSHSKPNSANIPSVFHGAPKGAVEEIKNRYDGPMRELWNAGGDWQVGTDAAGIQLRILAHYMQSQDYVDAIVTGDKALETDIHNLNRKAIGVDVCRDRDTAKTWIYAWLLGASAPLQASILGCTAPVAKAAETTFLTNLPELKRIKDVMIPKDLRKGYFTGLDGRKVPCRSAHLMLAGYLQNGEAVCMKHANVLWRKSVKGAGLDYQQMNFVHDEWQTRVRGTLEEAEEVGRLQRESLKIVGEELGLFCPLDGETIIGRNWKECH